MAMTLMTRRDPFGDFETLIRRAFPARTDMAPAGSAAAATVDFRPSADVVRDHDDALVTLELPGVDAVRDVTVELDRGALVVRGERRDERSGQSAGRTVREIRYGSFRRSFALPEHITAETLSASYDAGVLTVRVAGAYAGSEPRKIPVTAPGHVPVASPATVDVQQDSVDSK